MFLAFLRRFIMGLALLAILDRNLDKKEILLVSCWASFTF